jgi:hypothetical protein
MRCLERLLILYFDDPLIQTANQSLVVLAPSEVAGEPVREHRWVTFGSCGSEMSSVAIVIFIIRVHTAPDEAYGCYGTEYPSSSHREKAKWRKEGQRPENLYDRE